MLGVEKSLIMDINLEKNDGTISSLFQQIIFDMKNSSPLWEDFVAKATKLHACLRAAIQAIAAYLEAFQKIADAATNSRGASKEIGTALTRVCLRHKAVETRMKTFTTAIMDCLIIPLQDKLEDWKRQVAILDKDHAKEYKKCRTELKKRSSDTLRLQKKAKKGQIDNLQTLVDSSMQDVSLRRAELEDVERKSLRAAMIEERMRFCTFVNLLQPVVQGECEVMQELGHLQEAMDTIERVTKEPQVLPPASEELILDTKAVINLYPDSPGGSNSQGCSNSLGSRKSSVCSISSMNSSGSSGSPGHQFQRSLSQYSPALRLKPGESSDSGFCSSPALTSQVSTSTSQTCPVSTWPPHNQDTVPSADRPHTISSAYEKGHQRPALTVYTFQNPEIISECQKSPANILCRPPLPVRCSSLERPLSSTGVRNPNAARQCPSPIPVHVTKEHPPPPQPTYVNMTELASMAAFKITNSQQQQPPAQPLPQQQQQQQQQPQYQQLFQANPNSPVLSSTSSLVSPDSASATNPISSISSPDGVSSSACSSQTPQNVSPEASTTPTGGDGGGIETSGISPNSIDTNSDISVPSKSITNDLTKNNSPSPTTTDQDNTNKIKSPATDIISSGSVLAKTSLFEKLEQQIVSNSQLATTPTNPTKMVAVENIYAGSNNVGNKRPPQQQQQHHPMEEIYKSSGDSDLTKPNDNENISETDQLNKQTIEELNNLIGELDLFQKEQETAMLMEEQKQKTKSNLHQNNNNNNHNNSKYHHNDITSSPYMSIRKSPANFSDKISISSSNFESPNHSLTSSTNVNCSSGNYTFNYSDTELSKYVNDNDSYDLTNTGFENPSFIHMNDSEIVVIHQNDYPTESENIYNQNMSEVVVLRCKDEMNKIPIDNDVNYNSDSSSVGGGGGSVGLVGTQRLSSFKVNGTADTASQLSTHSSGYGGSYSANSSPIMSNGGHSVDFKSILDDRLRNKPAITPRPASLSGVSRIARRSSINTIKPPPPVRRSSSVTPSHNLGTNSPSLLHQMNATSSESLPPPPAYLLDTTSANNLSPSNVAGTIKALNEIRHTPASPGVLRKAQQLQQYYQQQQIQQQYSHPTPKYDTSASLIQQPPPPTITATFPYGTSNSETFSAPLFPQATTPRPPKTSQGGPPKPSPGFMAQLSARIAPNKPQHHQQPTAQSHYQQHLPSQNQNRQTAAPTKEQMYQQYQQQQQQHYATTNNDYQHSSNHDKSGNVMAKTSVSFMENLNARLAEQRLSGKAFAVRNFINSKAVPDPRVCHESLMDQIKRGSALKQNRTINDRSAPKIIRNILSQ